MEKDDNFHEKEDVLRKTLASRPQNAKAMSQLSSLLWQESKRSDDQALQKEAQELAQKAIQLQPTKPFGYAAFSIVAPQWKERRKALLKAITLSGDQFRLARLGLRVRLLLEQRREEAKTTTWGKGNSNHPKRRCLNLQELQLNSCIQEDLKASEGGDTNDHPTNQAFLAQQEFQLGLFFRKKQPASANVPRSRHHFRQALRYDPKDETAKFWLGTLSEDGDATVITKCPANYVVALYSTFCEHFDTLLVEQLSYQTPSKLRELFDACVGPKCRGFNVCDLGCGTGLSGLAFQDLARNMVGVDLSPDMVAKAKERGCYSELVVGDVETALALGNLSILNFQLILACDVFCYIGDLSGVFQKVHKKLGQDGHFLFSTELLHEKEDQKERSYHLHSCARFAHSQKYIEEIAGSSGFQQIRMQTACIRKNEGRDVEGLLVVLQKS